MSHLLNLKQTTDLIIKWIRSCDTAEQLNMCKDIRDEYIRDRFKHHCEYLELTDALSEVDHSIEEQKGKIILNRYESNNILTTTN
jgi:hypothetical protein